jgi:hypothetical protein
MNMKLIVTQRRIASVLPLALTPWAVQAAENIGTIMDRINEQVNPTLFTLTAIFFTVGFAALGIAGYSVFKHGKGAGVPYGGGGSLKTAAYAFAAGVLLIFMGLTGGTLGQSIWGDNPAQSSSSGINTVTFK